MPLTLVTGPANAAKAGEVFGRLRAARRTDPLLVVPTTADVAHYRRELAHAGLVLGPEVVTFDGLVREVGRVTGVSARPVGPLARERLVAATVAATPLRTVGAAAGSPGFAAAAGELFAELRHARATPGRLAAALRSWAGDDPARAAHGDDLVALFGAYDERLRALGRPDAEQHGWDVLTALRLAPSAWGARPVAFYGWDDLSPVQVDAVETLAGPAEAPVTLSLAYEPGRVALAARTGLVDRLSAVAAEHVRLDAVDDHYATPSRAALHHLERRLFEGRREEAPPGEAVRLLEAGGERAEAELVAAEVLAALAAGVAPDEIAIVLRAAEAERTALADVLAGLGIPIAAGGTVPFGTTALGAGLAALARAASPDGTAEDVLRWLRTPGRLRAPEPADELERRVRRREIGTARGARRAWEEGHPPLEELDRVAAAAAQGPAALLSALEEAMHGAWTAPHARRGAVMDVHGHADARIAASVARHLADLRDLAAMDPACLGTVADVPELLGALRVPAAVRPPVAPPGPDAPVAGQGGAGLGGGVLVADPAAIRGRRFRVVVVCALQEGVFPGPGRPDPFLDDTARRELAAASGLVLPVREDGPGQERFLFYACASRPTDRLVLSFRSSDEEGAPQEPSPFIADVRELFGASLWTGRRRRMLADVAWPPAAAPTARELRRSLQVDPAPEPGPLGPPESAAVLALLAARDKESARGLEAFGACGVRWLVERVLRPRPVDPDEDPLRRGSLAHRAMERALRLLRERTGSARLTPDRLEPALAALGDALAELAADPAVRRRGAQGRVLLRELELELGRVIRDEAETGPGLEPTHLEWAFGTGEDGAAPALELAGLQLSGRVDRVDVDLRSGEALVRDYKGAAVTAGARWEEERRLQAALYLLAVEQRLGLRAAGAVYQPLRRGGRPRGLVREDSAAAASGQWVRTDVRAPAAFAEDVERLTRLAARLAEDLRAGRIAACPERCGPDGCAYPTICRAEA